MWKKYWKFNDWVFEKVTGEKVDSTQEWKEIIVSHNIVYHN